MITSAPKGPITGNRETGFKSSHFVGAAVGVLTGVANLAQGSSLAGAAAGAVIGGAMGYAVGDVFGITDELGSSARIINGGLAGLVGMSFSGMTTSLVDSIIKPAGSAE